jgi:hypothetical protein
VEVDLGRIATASVSAEIKDVRHFESSLFSGTAHRYHLSNCVEITRDIEVFRLREFGGLDAKALPQKLAKGDVPAEFFAGT